MPATDNLKVPIPKAGWFSRLSRRRQALLLALLMFAVSAVCFLLGMHDLHAGGPMVSMAGRSDWTDGLLLSAAGFVLGLCLLAVALGWKPEGSKAQSPK
jgi:hypothetical protein